jgi:hypothetical protein
MLADSLLVEPYQQQDGQGKQAHCRCACTLPLFKPQFPQRTEMMMLATWRVGMEKPYFHCETMGQRSNTLRVFHVPIFTITSSAVGARPPEV